MDNFDCPEGALKMDGYDDCVIGIVERINMSPVLLYSRPKVIKRLMKDGMNRDEAEEFFEFNQLGAWIGEGTPAFATLGKVDCG